MGQIEDGVWRQLEVEDKQLPTAFVKACFTNKVKTAVKARIEAALTEGNTELKDYDGIENMGVLGIFCGISELPL